LIQGSLAATWSAHNLDGTFGIAQGAILLRELVALEAGDWDRKKVFAFGEMCQRSPCSLVRKEIY
jgi:hypothetical protein